jgi:putative restriction endonuclease
VAWVTLLSSSRSIAARRVPSRCPPSHYPVRQQTAPFCGKVYRPLWGLRGRRRSWRRNCLHGARWKGREKRQTDSASAPDKGNLALAHSSVEGLPVRVVRGTNLDSVYAPRSGYRYDGHYMVDDYWQVKGRSGFRVWRYRLIKLPSVPTRLDVVSEGPAAYSTPQRREMTVQRLVRDTAQARRIKAIYYYRCQMCGTRLEGLAGPYAEAAHIRPLGTLHNGPDTPENILCLCPNHHVLFDRGGVVVAEDLSLIGADGRLTVQPQHRVSEYHLHYRREHYQVND